MKIKKNWKILLVRSSNKEISHLMSIILRNKLNKLRNNLTARVYSTPLGHHQFLMNYSFPVSKVVDVAKAVVSAVRDKELGGKKIELAG